MQRLQMITLTKYIQWHSVRRSTTLGKEVCILQARLLPGLSLLADGGPNVSGNARIQFY